MTHRRYRRVQILSVAVLTLVFGGSNLHAADGETPGGPRIRFDVTTHDFGDVGASEQTGYDWVYHNDGDAPLTIIKTHSSCGCTATVLDGEIVPPGGSGTLKVAFDATGLRGSVRKTIAVSSNDKTTPRILLTVRANILEEEIQEEGGHPRTAGQSLLVGECAACHAAPAENKTGADLYAAVCAVCHGESGGGDSGPSLRDPAYLASHTDQDVSTAIAYGTANPKMPGFVDLMGGPLNGKQVDSLVELLRTWGPLSAGDSK